MFLMTLKHQQQLVGKCKDKSTLRSNYDLFKLNL